MIGEPIEECGHLLDMQLHSQFRTITRSSRNTTWGQFLHFWLGPEQNWQLPNLKTSSLSNFSRPLP